MVKILAGALSQPQESGSEPRSPSGHGYPIAVAAAFLALAVVALLFLLRYPLQGFRYPVGWDATWYVFRANAAAFEGLAYVGTNRAATPLLLSMLMRATGQNGFTMVALAAPLFAGVAGLAVAAMLRSALGTRLLWLPVIGVLTWVAFGGTGLLSGYIDQTLNVAFVLAGFAAAVVLLAGGKGALAATLLFMGAGLAEWPFYGFAMLVFGLAILLFLVAARRYEGSSSVGAMRRLSGAMLASGAFTLLTLVGIPAIGNLDLESARGPEKLGVDRRISPPRAVRRLLKRRFLESTRDATRYLGLALAGLGALAAARTTVKPQGREARRLFLCLMLAWLLLTAVAAIAQLLNFPVAGARLLLYFFPVPILIGVLVWALARFVAWRVPRPIGPIVAVLLVLGITGGLTANVWRSDHRRAWVERQAVAQLTAAGMYLTRFAPDREVVFSLGKVNTNTIVRRNNTIRAGLPPAVVPRVRGSAVGSPLDYLDSLPSGSGSSLGANSSPVVVVIEAYNRAGFNEAHLAFPDSFVSPGVLALNGPFSPEVIPEQPAPTANTRLVSLLWLVSAITLILLLLGGGWSIVLLPADPLVRAALSPALGLAVASLVALTWDRLSLGLHGWWAVGPLVVAGASGWGLAWAETRR
jgi:hypothetical protein